MSLFGNFDSKQESNLFSSSNNKNTNSQEKTNIFGSKNENLNFKTSLFGFPNESKEVQNESKYNSVFLFGQINNSLSNIHNEKNDLFSESPFSLNNKRTNKKLTNKKFIKCNHPDKYCAFCLKEKIYFICYECIYKYNIDINDCIPMDKNFEYYKNIYQNHFKLIKQKIEDKFNEFMKEIEKLEINKSDDNIESLIKNIDLNFELPIEVSFEERLKIGINKTLRKIFNNTLWVKNFDNYLNLYESKLKDLKTKASYLYEKETISIKSGKFFILKGIGIPKIPENLKKDINISLSLKMGSLFNNPFQTVGLTLEESENEKNLAIVRFEKPIDIEPNIDVAITLSGIKGINFIDNAEEYNQHNHISIESNNPQSTLAALIIG